MSIRHSSGECPTCGADEEQIVCVDRDNDTYVCTACNCKLGG